MSAACKMTIYTVCLVSGWFRCFNIWSLALIYIHSYCCRRLPIDEWEFLITHIRTMMPSAVCMNSFTHRTHRQPHTQTDTRKYIHIHTHIHRSTCFLLCFDESVHQHKRSFLCHQRISLKFKTPPPYFHSLNVIHICRRKKTTQKHCRVDFDWLFSSLLNCLCPSSVMMTSHARPGQTISQFMCSIGSVIMTHSRTHSYSHRLKLYYNLMNE